MYFPGAASLLMIRGREISISSCSYLIPPLQIPSPVEEGRSSESALRGGGLEVEERFHIHYIYNARERGFSSSASPISVIWMAEMGWSWETYLMTMMRVTMAFLPCALFATT